MYMLTPDTGITWTRRLVLRGKLTMHTAYERRDNACPASVTAVAAARSGRGLAVGDARGRVTNLLLLFIIKTRKFVTMYTCVCYSLTQKILNGF